MGPFADDVADFQLVRLDERWPVHSIPIRDRLIMFGGFILAAVFELDAGVLAKGHQVSQEKTVGGFDPILVTFSLFHAAGAGGMAGEGQGHVAPAPIIATAAPFLRAGALGLWCLTVIKEKARVAFERVEHGAVREYPGGANEMARPIAAAFGVARVEQD